MNKNKPLFRAIIAVALLAAVYAGAVVATEGNVWPGPQVWNGTVTANDDATFNDPVTMTDTLARSGPETVTFTTVATTYSLAATDLGIMANSSNGAFTITMGTPSAAGRVVPIYLYNGTDAVSLTNINGATNTDLNAAGESIHLVSNGTTWVGKVH